MLADNLPGDNIINLKLFKNFPSRNVNAFNTLSANLLKDLSSSSITFSPHALQYLPVKEFKQFLHDLN
jgi:hypothetical protein